MVPVATYRIQLTGNFTLVDAADLVPYLAKLGIDHLYTSPALQARKGSLSGYDVTDPSVVNAELGGQAAHEHLSRRLAAHNMRRMVDIVPNHMAIASNENPWWNDVLKNGRASRYANWFDVDWEASDALWPNRVLLPVLRDQFGRELEAGNMRLRHHGGMFTLCYHELCFPIDPVSCATLLHRAANGELPMLQFLAESLRDLPRQSISMDSELERRQRNQQILEGMLQRLCEEQPDVVTAIDREVERINQNLQELGELLEAQHYRLAFWQAADFDLGYRRFFNINELAGLRVELPEVFDEVQALPLQWIHDGEAHALRVDHPDGLRNPTQYFQTLRAAAPSAWIVAEKILAYDETLPKEWPVDGTTGYEFANLVQRLFVDPEAEAPMTQWYEEFTGATQTYEERLLEAKEQVMHKLLGSELNRLTSLLRAVCERHWRHRDHPQPVLSQVLVSVIAHFQVYRTYVQPQVLAGEVDRQRIAEAIKGAREANPSVDEELMQFLEKLLLMEVEGTFEQEFALRFQQLTSPVMAKGLEDTLLYRYLRLSALNEVGSEPSLWHVSVDEFHRKCQEMTQWPRSMLATSTHDTKRSEDVRARMIALTEMPQVWINAVCSWHDHNTRHQEGLDPDTEYLYYQTLVGAWPIEKDRILAYMEKAVREAKVHTEWTQQNNEYEETLRNFIDATLKDEEFIKALESMVTKVDVPGRINSLAQLLIKLTAPGVPDIYQGCELWDFSLCDPDNRRPVDFPLRRRLLDELDTLDDPEAIMARLDEGLPKLWVLRNGLRVRRERAECFSEGSAYTPLIASGMHADHVVAYGRGGCVVTVVPRLWASLPHSEEGEGRWGEWGDTALQLPEGEWRNALDPAHGLSGEVRMAELFARVPLALLVKES